MRKKSVSALANLKDRELLRLRFKDLSLQWEMSGLSVAVSRLYDELQHRGLGRFRPHAWLSTEWFSAVGVPGIAVPFYLASPRLIELERTQMGQVEGETQNEVMKILRHEAGHALLTAYGLRSRADVQVVFGDFKKAYPRRYRPRPHSRSHVRHLSDSYAQSHPDEDFAETFAVWLTPRSGWRRKYRGWAVYAKLQFIERLVKELSEQRPIVTNRKQVDSIQQIEKTLGEHYRSRRAYFGVGQSVFSARELSAVFTSFEKKPSAPLAQDFIRKIRRQACRSVAQETSQRHYTVARILKEIEGCCRERGLRLRLEPKQAGPVFEKLLIQKSLKFLREKRDYISL